MSAFGPSAKRTLRLKLGRKADWQKSGRKPTVRFLHAGGEKLSFISKPPNVIPATVY